MADEIIKNLNFRVVEHTSYEDKVIHIENVSYDMAVTLVYIMNKQYDSYFVAEDMSDD